MDTFQLIGGDFGRGEGRYENGSMYLPSGAIRSIVLVKRVATNASFLQRDWMKAIGNGAGLGAAVGVLGLFAAPAVALAVPFGLTVAAVAGGLALWHSGTSDAVLVEVAFQDGKHFVAIAETYVPGLFQNDLALARKVGWIPPSPPLIDAQAEAEAEPGLLLTAATQAASAAGEVLSLAVDKTSVALSATGGAAVTAASVTADAASRAAEATWSAAGEASIAASDLAGRAAASVKSWLKR